MLEITKASMKSNVTDLILLSNSYQKLHQIIEKGRLGPKKSWLLDKLPPIQLNN